MSRLSRRPVVSASHSRWLLVTASLLVASLEIVGCSDDDDDTTPPAAGGQVTSAGASGDTSDGATTSLGGGGNAAGGAPSAAGGEIGAGAGGTLPVGGASPVGGAAGEAGAPSEFSLEVLPIDPGGDADPSSLYWSDGGHYLLVADNRHNRIWKWESGSAFSLYATTDGLPKDPQASGTTASRDNVGQVVELADGTVVVVRFGFGTHSGISWVDPGAGTSGELPGLDPTRRRISLLVTAAGDLFGGYFTVGNENQRIGAITRLDWDQASGGSGGEAGAGAGPTEIDYAPGFAKPVGLLEMPNFLLAVDQDRNVIYRLPKDASAPLSGSYEVYARVAAPDQLSHGPDDTVFTGQFRPVTAGGTLAVRQIFPDGSQKILDEGLTRPSGLAYDAAGRRLFVADSNGSSVRTIRVYQLK